MQEDMSNSPGGRESPSSTASSNTASGSGCGSVIGSVGSGSNSNGCRNSGASFDSGRATSTTFHGVRYSAGLSSESSLGSFRHSYHSSSSSLGSLPSEEIRNFDVAAMISQGVPDHEILNAWLSSIHLECYYQNFVQAGYDMQTISRMTPEDLNAIGVTKPHHRKKIKSEISQLNISEGLPDFIPETMDEWLRLLKLDEYLPRLLDQGYRNVRQVTNITWEDLDDIGILKLGHQKKFMLAIKRVQDIASGKRVPSAVLTPNSYITSLVDNFHHQRHATSLPYTYSSPPVAPPVNNSQESSQYQDPRRQIHRNMWPHQQQQIYQTPVPLSPAGTNAVSHQIQIHHPPASQAQQHSVTSLNHSQPLGVVQPLYHPEVISIRVKNSHGTNSIDSPPEEEPIYGTSSFHPNPPSSHNGSPASTLTSRSRVGFKSFEEGETSPTSSKVNGHCGNNLSMTRQSMSNTWTLPRLQKHKPISKVMGGGMASSCDSSVSYPINPGPFAPQQLNPPVGPAPMVSTFGKGEYAAIKGQPPPPPARRSSCSSLSGSMQCLEDSLPLPPPPPPESHYSSESLATQNKSSPYSGEPLKQYGMSSSFYGQRSAPGSYQNVSASIARNNLPNGGRSTLPLTKSRDQSPASGDFSDADLTNQNGLTLSKGVRRNGSDASFKSNSSTESESIPFANDNAGTIKQQKPAQRLPQQGDGTNGQQEESGDVLSDIGTMLADLTDQLDAILEQERTAKV